MVATANSRRNVLGMVVNSSNTTSTLVRDEKVAVLVDSDCVGLVEGRTSGMHVVTKRTARSIPCKRRHSRVRGDDLTDALVL
jgi:hypothetical protein